MKDYPIEKIIEAAKAHSEHYEQLFQSSLTMGIPRRECLQTLYCIGFHDGLEASGLYRVINEDGVVIEGSGKEFQLQKGEKT